MVFYRIVWSVRPVMHASYAQCDVLMLGTVVEAQTQVPPVMFCLRRRVLQAVEHLALTSRQALAVQQSLHNPGKFK